MRNFQWTPENCETARTILCEYPHNLRKGFAEIAAHFNLTINKVSSAFYNNQTRLCKYCREHPVVKVISGDNRKMCLGNKNAVQDVNGELAPHIMFFSVQDVHYTIR